MYQFDLDISQLKRESGFPYRLSKVFYCRDLVLHASRGYAPSDHFEVCLRLESKSAVCEDIINGEPIHLPFPHAVWKLPQQTILTRDERGRDVLALLYPPESVELFRQADMIPPRGDLPFTVTPQISSIMDKIVSLVKGMNSAGVADKLDWLGFSLIKEVLMAGRQETVTQTMEQKMNDIALWLTVHCAEPPEFHVLAEQNDMSYTCFYREWRRFFDVTPLQFVINARLKTAAGLLEGTDIPISRIVRIVNFSGTYAFYRRFREKYGVSPRQYRENFRAGTF
ncbi:MAG: helix-turn-helix transcriptional regulator [Lentisphaeria bacterium]|nr:helix-turn-helix transcriptional regulator [Lentisphaeria bacterium]